MSLIMQTVAKRAAAIRRARTSEQRGVIRLFYNAAIRAMAEDFIGQMTFEEARAARAAGWRKP